ncbi:MAG: M20/M25/M40 family metallo-hydrolase [Acidobacteriota bacterium]|nr:M20/M25/M40 family metallo-hydrolase [Acidobacteriota bacterium]
MAAPVKFAPEVSALTEILQSRGIADTLQWFSREKKWINERHLELCRIPAPTFHEQKRAEWMLALLRSLGWNARIDRTGNVVAQLTERRDGPLIALTAHLDTVLSPRLPEDVSPQPDGAIRGPGVSDNGAGLSALIAIARAISMQPDLHSMCRPLLLVANVGEEGEGNLSGMRYLCRQSGTGSRIASFLVLDGPNTDHITSQALASRRFEILVSGPGGHSWSDYGTANPVHALSRAIAMFTDQPIADQRPRSSYNFGILEGGSGINSIPTQARAKLDIRSESAARMDEIAAFLTQCVERALETENERAASGRVTAKIREIGTRPGGGLADDAPLLGYLRAVDSHLGIRATLDCASTDANIPLSLGIPAVSIGAGGQGGGAHTPQEWFHPDGRELGLKRILLTLMLLLRDLEVAPVREPARNGG